ncbi:MAG: PIN domain-containing protein [Campylobacterales bacterium]|nr:PIN domain-containing protein [Campylobacterales bacterium]
MILVDANYILRFLLKDNREMYELSRDIICKNDCIILNEVLAEVVYVLLKVYSVEKNVIKSTLIEFLQHKNIIIDDKNSIIEAIEMFEYKNLDFVDCILCAKSKNYVVKTFGKKLNSCLQR